MPTYEYKCTQEGTTFDIWQEVGAQAPPCPVCGAPSKKVFRPTRTIFKGSGFYITDTRSESGKSSGGKAEGGPGESSSGEAASSDSTPATGGSETKAADSKAATG